MYTDLWL